MTFSIQFSAGALRDLYALPDKVAWAVIAFCEGPLAETPARVGKPLQSHLSGLYSARRGEYRVIYRIEESTVTVDVIRIRHRGDAYRPD